MTLKVTVPNTSSDSLTFGSANTPTAAQVIGIDSGSSNGQLAFNTTASGTSTERMRIDASGNVGIGTSSPSYKLDVNGSIRGDTFVRSTSGTVSSYLVANNGGGFGVVGTASNHPILFNTNDTERARIDTSGNLLVGTTNSGFTSGTGVKLRPGQDGAVSCVDSASTSASTSYVMYSTGAGAYRFYVNWAGTIFATSTTISAISDQRLKENVRDLDVGLNEVLALKPRKFDWKEGKGKDIKNDRGFIAQEFEQVFPDLIDEWKDPAPEGEEPYKSVRQDLIPVLVKAIQEQQAIINAQQAALESLTNRITALEAK